MAFFFTPWNVIAIAVVTACSGLANGGLLEAKAAAPGTVELALAACESEEASQIASIQVSLLHVGATLSAASSAHTHSTFSSKAVPVSEGLEFVPAASSRSSSAVLVAIDAEGTEVATHSAPSLHRQERADGASIIIVLFVIMLIVMLGSMAYLYNNSWNVEAAGQQAERHARVAAVTAKKGVNIAAQKVEKVTRAKDPKTEAAAGSKQAPETSPLSPADELAAQAFKAALQTGNTIPASNQAPLTTQTGEGTIEQLNPGSDPLTPADAKPKICC